MNAERADGSEIEGAVVQLTMYDSLPLKACLEVWDPDVDNDVVLVSVKFTDGDGHLVGMRVASVARDDHWATAMATGLDWWRAIYEELVGPFDR